MPSEPLDNKKDDGLTPSQQQAAGFSRQFAMAMELPFVIVAAVAVGGVIGFFLDRWLHTKPYLMLILGFLGFLGGMRDVIRRRAAAGRGTMPLLCFAHGTELKMYNNEKRGDNPEEFPLRFLPFMQDEKIVDRFLEKNLRKS